MRRAPATGYGSGEESACHWIRFWGGERLLQDKVLGRRAPATGYGSRDELDMLK